MIYAIDKWGDGYFGINESGHVTVSPNRSTLSGDLYNLVKTLVEQGIEAPLLLRFNGILKNRIDRIENAFKQAIEKFDYRSSHFIAYPIKVNPLKYVVESVIKSGVRALEVGSKPELLAVVALPNYDMILCNGYKDEEYIGLAIMAQKLGKRVIIIIEQIIELKLVLDISKKMGVEAEIGFRMKLSTPGSGKWISSGGEGSKFGLYTYEIMEALETLHEENKLGWLKLLHFHMGSQINDIDSIRMAIKEAVRMYTELKKTSPALEFLDVGGGLAVDYEGSHSEDTFSMNYSLEDYADDIIKEVGAACLKERIPDPIIITESGRAIVSQHAVLITEVIDITQGASDTNNLSQKKQILKEFIEGKKSLQDRATEEKKLHSDSIQEIYFCNFSVFQSLPDSWAIDQIFPVMPIHRLNETESVSAILADLSCDSDGKIDHFIGPSANIPLHPYTGEPYYIAIFMVGAYQEVMGGLHNLFGDTNVVQADLDQTGNWNIKSLVEGDTIEEVLSYVQYNPEELKNQFFESVEKALKAALIQAPQAAELKVHFKKALESYTYLVK